MKSESKYHGILLLDKEEGPTSTDCLRVLKKKLGKKIKVGHAGTLDPMARGLLVVLFGKATRLSEVVMAGEKRYDAVFRLGEATETGDRDGAVVWRGSIEGITAESVDELLPRFTGSIRQRPPAFAAIKIDGKRAYQRARAGEEFEIPEREVDVHEFRRTGWNPPDVSFFIRTGRGAYLRALARDLGEALGCGAHVFALTRTGVGHFDLTNAVRLDEIEPDRMDDLLLPAGAALDGYPRFVLRPAGVRALKRGRLPRAEDFVERPREPLGEVAGIFGPEGELVGICRIGPVGTISDRRLL